MIYKLILKFNNRYITKFENTTWDEAKGFYKEKLIKCTPKGGQLENQYQ